MDGEEKVMKPSFTKSWKKVSSNSSVAYVYNYPKTKIRPSKIVAFDMDGTLIEYNPGRLSDVKWMFPSVPERLKALADAGSTILVLSNQGGVGAKKTTLPEVQKRVEKLVSMAGLDMSVVIAPYYDYFRKPYIGMWRAFEREFVDVAPSKDCITYVGDMCGRREGKVKDKAAGDLFLARNWGVAFKSPEAFFLDSTDALHTNFKGVKPAFDPVVFRKMEKPNLAEDLCASGAEQEMVLLVGPPASGKSSLCANHFSSYVRVNLDDMKTKKKCLDTARRGLENKRCVIVDNTNRDVQARKQWVDLAKEFNVPIRAVFVKAEKDWVFHNVVFRSLGLNGDDDRHLADVIIHRFYKEVQMPKEEEGFSEVISIPFYPDTFLTREAEEAYFSILTPKPKK